MNNTIKECFLLLMEHITHTVKLQRAENGKNDDIVFLVGTS